MNKSKISKILSLSVLIALGSTLVACGTDAKQIKNETKSTIATENNNTKSDETSEEKEKPIKIDFSKYSNEDLVTFVNSATDEIENMRRSSGGGIPIESEKYSITEVDEDIITKRETTLLKYYNEVSLMDEYENKDGKVYLKDYYWDSHIPYLFTDVKSKEVINDTTLRVIFNAKFYHGFPVVNKNTKTIDFTEINGHLKAITSLSDKSIYGVIENKDESRPIEEVDNEAKLLWDYVYEKLNDGILRPDQKVQGIGERYYDSKNNAIYYGVGISEPTQSAISYFVNIATGDIYGHYEGKFVVKSGKVVK